MLPENVMQKVAEGRPYMLLVLLAGPQPPGDPAQMQELQLQHLAHLFTLEEEGRISVFGPIMHHDRRRGIVICNSTDAHEIDAWMRADPFIRGGYLVYELHSFFTIPGQSIAKGV